LPATKLLAACHNTGQAVETVDQESLLRQGGRPGVHAVGVNPPYPEDVWKVIYASAFSSHEVQGRVSPGEAKVPGGQRVQNFSAKHWAARRNRPVYEELFEHYVWRLLRRIEVPVGCLAVFIHAEDVVEAQDASSLRVQVVRLEAQLVSGDPIIVTVQHCDVAASGTRNQLGKQRFSGSPHVLLRIKCLDPAGVTLNVLIDDRPCGVRRAVIANKNLKRVHAALVENAIERAGDVARVIESGDQNTHTDRRAFNRFRCHSHATAGRAESAILNAEP
jgi:hypothetical protein